VNWFRTLPKSFSSLIAWSLFLFIPSSFPAHGCELSVLTGRSPSSLAFSVPYPSFASFPSPFLQVFLTFVFDSPFYGFIVLSAPVSPFFSRRWLFIRCPSRPRHFSGPITPCFFVLDIPSFVPRELLNNFLVTSFVLAFLFLLDTCVFRFASFCFFFLPPAFPVFFSPPLWSGLPSRCFCFFFLSAGPSRVLFFAVGLLFLFFLFSAT